MNHVSLTISSALNPQMSSEPKLNIWLSAGVLIVFGAVGGASTLLVLPDVPGAPRIALLINPMLLLVLFTIVGSLLAPKLGWRSVLAEFASGIDRGVDRRIITHCGIGLVLGLTVALVDHLLSPLFLTGSGVSTLVEGWAPSAFLVGLLYGGLTEEILVHWGLMSLLVWGLWKLFARNHPVPPSVLVWTGVAATSLLFAVGHLPALMLSGAELTAGLLIRTIGLNALVGLVFGWIFVRSDLENAAGAHASFHLGVALCAIGVVLVA